MIDIDSFPLLTLLKNNTYIKNNYKVNNLFFIALLES